MNSLALNLSIQGWWHSWSWQVLMRHWGKVICWVLLSLICPENLLVIPLCSLKAIKRGKKKQAKKNPFIFSYLLQKPQIPHSKSAASYLNVTEFSLTVGITLFWPGKLRHRTGGWFFPGHQVLMLGWRLAAPRSGWQRAGGTPLVGDLLLISSFFPHTHKSNAPIFFLKLELNEPRSNLRK